MFIVVILLFWLLLWLLFLIFLILVIIVIILIVLIILIVVVITITIITYYVLAQAHLPECPTLLTWRGAFHQFLLQEKFASSKVWLICGPGMLWWAAPCILVTAELAMVKTFLLQWCACGRLKAADFTLKACTIFFCVGNSQFSVACSAQRRPCWVCLGRPGTPWRRSLRQGWLLQLLFGSLTISVGRSSRKVPSLHRDIFEAHACGPQAAVRETAATFFLTTIYLSFLHQGSFSGPTQASSRAKLALKILVFFSEEFALIDGFLLKLHWHDRRCIYTASEHTCCKMLHPPQVGVVLKTTSRRTSGQSTTRPVAHPWQQGMPHCPRRESLDRQGWARKIMQHSGFQHLKICPFPVFSRLQRAFSFCSPEKCWQQWKCVKPLPKLSLAGRPQNLQCYYCSSQCGASPRCFQMISKCGQRSPSHQTWISPICRDVQYTAPAKSGPATGRVRHAACAHSGSTV